MEQTLGIKNSFSNSTSGKISKLSCFGFRRLIPYNLSNFYLYFISFDSMENLLTMKTQIALLLGLLFAANVCFAELKIGVVNMPTVLKETPQTEKALKRLEQEFSSRKKQLESQANELKSLNDKLNRDASVMSESERTGLEKKILNKNRDLERAREETGYDFNARRNEELGKLQRRIVEAIQSIAKEQSFDLILIDGVIFASDKIDITAQVQKKLASMPE